MIKLLSAILLSAFTALGLPAFGDEQNGWKSVDGIEGFHFQTDLMSGVFVARDHRDLGKGFGKHGLREFTYKGQDLCAPEPPFGGRRRHQGLLGLYRVYSSTESYGSLRDEQAELEKLADGARLTWPASSERPVAITGTWRITGPAQIDLLIEATPIGPIENLEVLMAVYLPLFMSKAVYLEGSDGPVASEILPSERYGDPLNYRYFALGEKEREAQQNSGRIHSSWKWNSVVPREVAALPVLFARNESLELILMADPESISAVCATPTPLEKNPADWNPVEQHSALYFSVFCLDAQPGETYTSRMRLHVIDKPDDPVTEHRRLYEEFLAD